MRLVKAFHGGRCPIHAALDRPAETTLCGHYIGYGWDTRGPQGYRPEQIGRGKGTTCKRCLRLLSPKVRAGPPAETRKRMRRVTLDVSAEDIELLREDAESCIESFQQGGRPRAVPDHKQPTEWHEGQTLLALAKRMQAAFRKARGA